MDRLVKKVRLWAEKNKALQAGTMVVIGVSGGADSVCLLHVLKQLAETISFSITAVHVNHMLRGYEADEDESFVSKLCGAWEIPLRVFREDVNALSEKERISIEEAGRIVRYDCFQRVLQETSANHIAVAHHAQDQAETIFLNLLRGSGLDGLCGMEQIQGHIIRPFLTTNKDEIYEYIERNGLLYRTDSSNLENSYARNTIRNSVFPQIEKETGTSIVSSLLRASQLLRTDRDYLSQMALSCFDKIKISEESETIILNRKEFLDLHQAMASRVLRIAWKKITGSTKGLEAKHVEIAFEIARRKNTGKSIDVPGGMIIKTDYNKLILSKKEKSAALPFSIDVHLPYVDESVLNKFRITAMIYSKEEYIKAFGDTSKQPEKSLVQLFDYNKIKRGINIRSRLPGDVFFPFGSPGKKKLKDFFIDEKISKAKRAELPLLADGERIVWVIGIRTAEDYKISEDTEVIIYVKITDINI
ncbi:MAG: tRNA lysidine(34) synthetase TilS [Ruminiclostridium sp.]|nr:tRNA lysidine(34) synthetase TilS [Ruminiclostridium sp.]